MNGKMIPLGHYVIGGIAFAGRYGINKVQIFLDNGKTWQEAEMKKPLSKWAWSLWRYDWNPEKEGKYTMKVRGVDLAGKVQESGPLVGRLFRSSTFPDGAKGYHSVNVTVKR